MAEKKYVSDNAQLMAEWNYEKNWDLDPNTITCGSSKKYGGYAIKGTNGRPQSTGKRQVVVVQFVVIRK